MDPKLAEIYGTNQDADLEKLAAAELAEGLANDDQLDTDGLSEDDLEAIAQDVLNGEDGVEASGDEGEEKLAEADYLGRVMAHSYVNELRSIEKEASGREPTPEELKKAKSFGKAVSQSRAENAHMSQGPSFGAKAYNKYDSAKKTVGKGADKVEGFGRKGTDAVGKAAKWVAESKAGKAVGKGAVATGKHIARNRGKYAIGGTAAALGGAAYGLSKKSSAMDTLVEARAQQILAESGIDADELELLDGQEKVSDPREALNSAVDERAWSLLSQYGVVPNEE